MFSLLCFLKTIANWRKSSDSSGSSSLKSDTKYTCLLQNRGDVGAIPADDMTHQLQWDTHAIGVFMSSPRQALSLVLPEQRPGVDNLPALVTCIWTFCEDFVECHSRSPVPCGPFLKEGFARRHKLCTHLGDSCSFQCVQPPIVATPHLSFEPNHPNHR